MVWAKLTLLGLVSVIQLFVFSTARAQVPPGFWRGTGSTDRISDLKWINLVVHYDSEFSFKTDIAGRVDGTATVRYTLRVDDTQLRTLLARSTLPDMTLALTPIPGAGTLGSVMGMATHFKELQGVDGSYNGGTVVRQGRIKGQFIGQQLHLEWASSPTTIPYTMYKLYALRQEPFKTDTSPAYSPWIVDATVSEPAKGHWEAGVPEGSSRKKTQTSLWTVFWSAHREPDAK